jgi:hypothetical protein
MARLSSLVATNINALYNVGSELGLRLHHFSLHRCGASVHRANQFHGFDVCINFQQFSRSQRFCQRNYRIAKDHHVYSPWMQHRQHCGFSHVQGQRAQIERFNGYCRRANLPWLQLSNLARNLAALQSHCRSKVVSERQRSLARCASAVR